MVAVWKISILGDGAVGKTSLRQKFMGESMKQDYLMTIGADFAVYRFRERTLHIWDLAGQQKFDNLMKGYLTGSLGCLVVFDVTEPQSFKNTEQWIKKMDNSLEKKIPFVLVGNKSDLRGKDPNQMSVPKEEGERYAKTLSEWMQMEIPYIETSALNGENVELIFEKLTESIASILEKKVRYYK